MQGFLSTELTPTKKIIIQNRLLKIIGDLATNGSFGSVSDEQDEDKVKRFNYEACVNAAVIVKYILAAKDCDEDIIWIRQYYNNSDNIGRRHIAEVEIQYDDKHSPTNGQRRFIVSWMLDNRITFKCKNVMTAARIFLLLENVSNTINLQVLLSEAVQYLDTVKSPNNI